MLKALYFVFAVSVLFLGKPCLAQEGNLWFPEIYAHAVANASNGDRESQEKLCNFIYHGVVRFPKAKEKNDNDVFSWLHPSHPEDSFQRKVARFFFKGGVVDDAEKIIVDLQSLAEKGGMDEQRLMGSCYFHTKIGSHNRESALEWYNKAATQGQARAQMSLSLRYLEGIHVKQDVDHGLMWLTKAAAAGLPEALNILGSFYLEGRYMPVDINKGFKLILSAAEKGDSVAQIYLAVHHFKLIKTQLPLEPNIQEGIKWLDLAYESGDLKAMYLYGALSFMGKHPKTSKKTGIILLKRAAKLGNQEAQDLLNISRLN